MRFTGKKRPLAHVYYGESFINLRDTNMDALLLREREISGRKALLCVVCDGIGSLEHGKYASETAVELLDQWFEGLTDAKRAGELLREAVRDTNTKIINSIREGGFHSASTLSALLLAEGAYAVVHLGDSRIYALEDNCVDLLTRDHISASGKLKMAIGHTRSPDLFCAGGNAGGKLFMVCSDGLYKRLDAGLLLGRGNIGSEAAMKGFLRQLTDSVVAKGEKDNMTAAFARAVYQ